jgi:hypothetical protein
MARECVLRDGEAMEFEDVVDARESECWWVWILRTDETDEEVDFLPRKPELRR